MLIECVPNLSEGRDAALLDTLAAQVPNLLDRCSDADHNRSVFTFAGTPQVVLAGALALAEAAFRYLNLTAHSGVHPRMGVLDVLPFIPVADASLADCARLAHSAAQSLWEQWQVPSFFYEAAGEFPLEEVRRQSRAGAAPHVGTGRHPTAGAVAVGARRFLIAWNIWLQTERLEIANGIARKIRASSGGYPSVKALGLPLLSRNLVQVSINSTDFEVTPLLVVINAVEELARQAGVTVIGSELIGLIPQRACVGDLRWMHPVRTLESLL